MTHTFYTNSDTISSLLTRIIEKWSTNPLPSWHAIYKGELNTLGQSSFNKFRLRASRQILKSTLQASRGYHKMMDIIDNTTFIPKGRVVSLCCGRGGWEQAISPNKEVEYIRSFTLGAGPGHVGHENFTELNFNGRHKVSINYADVTKLPFEPHDTLLFDGGESKSDHKEESDKFFKLFQGSVMRFINPNTKHFCFKILTPTDPRLQDAMKTIQNITQTGKLYRCQASRPTSLELYFISGDTGVVEIDTANLLHNVMERAKVEPGETLKDDFSPDTEYTDAVDLLPPLDLTKSIKQHHDTFQSPRLAPTFFRHWISVCFFFIPTHGTNFMARQNYMWQLIRGLASSLPGLDNWMTTDTTPVGFMRVFRKKIDKTPLEKSIFDNKIRIIYEGLAYYFLKKGFRWHTLTEPEMIEQANMQGASAVTDRWANVADFFRDSNWRKYLTLTEKSLMEGQPINGIFNTMGKREKKFMTGEQKGSRMIAFLPIPMRMLELRTFHTLMTLTKPIINRFGVGGLGLHDYGEHIRRVWKGYGSSSDIAGFDTQIGLRILSMEFNCFIRKLGAPPIAEKLYRLYSYPHLLIPTIFDKNMMELVRGIGQRMSGSNPTYSMNTITRIMLMILQIAESDSINEESLFDFVQQIMDSKSHVSDSFGGAASGDDAFITTTQDKVRAVANAGPILDRAGFPRKDVPLGRPDLKAVAITDINFCSHYYEPITYYDSSNMKSITRYMPARSVAEIIGKASIRLSGETGPLTTPQWLKMQGLNLMVLYHHLRTPRLIGQILMKIDAKIPEIGNYIKYRPWLKEGHVLDIINEVLFGESSYYPEEGFKVRSISHLGYMNQRREIGYDPNSFNLKRSKWRETIRQATPTII